MPDRGGSRPMSSRHDEVGACETRVPFADASIHKRGMEEKNWSLAGEPRLHADGTATFSWRPAATPTGMRSGPSPSRPVSQTSGEAAQRPQGAVIRAASPRELLFTLSAAMGTAFFIGILLLPGSSPYNPGASCLHTGTPSLACSPASQSCDRGPGIRETRVASIPLRHVVPKTM